MKCPRLPPTAPDATIAVPDLASGRGWTHHMSDPPSPASPTPFDRQPDDRLDSWKEIAAYMKRDVTTVQRWEKREGMPVHRHVHDKMGSVYAFRTDLDAWARRRSPALVDEAVQGGQQPGEERPAAERGFVGDVERDLQSVNGTSAQEAATPARDAARPPSGSWRQRGRDGRMDLWLTQVGSGEFHTLTPSGRPSRSGP